jgi:hypothetical protein
MQANQLKKFIFIYSAALLISNLACLVIAFKPSSIGLYVVYFLGLPINLIFIFLALLLSYLMIKKSSVAHSFFQYMLLLSLPIMCFLALFYLVSNFAPKGAC